MAKAKKITLDDLLNRKLDNGFQSREIEVKGLGGTITVIKQPLTTIMRIIDDMDMTENTSDKIGVFANLIYKCVPLFHDKKLQEKYECAEPQDIVFKVLDNNMKDIEALGLGILEFYGLDGTDIQAELKK